MSNYTKATNFANKDTLPSGSADKVVRGAEIDAEFVAIQTAVNSKADTNNNTFTGDVSFTGSVSLDDNAKLKLGDSNDLQIYHDGSDSIIKDSGSGVLKYESDTNSSFGTIFEIKNTDTSNNQSGSYVSFVTPSTTSGGIKLGSDANGLNLIWGSNPSHSFSEYGLNLRQGALIGAISASITIGTGAPESQIEAPVGSLYLRTDGSSGQVLYVKESGIGNTGWVAK